MAREQDKYSPWWNREEIISNWREHIGGQGSVEITPCAGFDEDDIRVEVCNICNSGASIYGEAFVTDKKLFDAWLKENVKTGEMQNIKLTRACRMGKVVNAITGTVVTRSKPVVLVDERAKACGINKDDSKK